MRLEVPGGMPSTLKQPMEEAAGAREQSTTLAGNYGAYISLIIQTDVP